MHRKISYKLIVAVGAVAIVVIGVFAYVTLDSHQRQLLDELELSGNQLTETIKSSTHYCMLQNQREGTHRIISAIARQEGIEKVRIFNKEGEIIFSTDSLDVGRMVDKRTEACYMCHAADQPLRRLPVSDRTRIFHAEDGTRTFAIINPIYNEPSCSQSDCHAHDPGQTVLGVLDISMSMAEIDRDRARSQMELLWFALIAIAAISLIIYFLVGRIVLKPLGKVVEATQKVAEGDLTHTIELRKRDEIGQLANAFNEMMQRLSETQRQLIQSNRLSSVGRLAAGVAHEINNPLTGVLTYSSFLLKKAEDHPQLKEDLEVIVRETKRCRAIVKGLLDFSRQSVSQRRPIQINDAIHNSCRIVQNQLSLQKTRIELRLADTLPLVLADMSRMHQVLVNLLVNAADAMGEEGGTVTVETRVATAADTEGEQRPPDGQVLIRVRDTGCGISRENLDRIFEPFFTTKEGQGTGLGLAIVWGIIERHNGRLRVDSEVGVGTTFTILLPIAKPTAVV